MYINALHVICFYNSIIHQEKNKEGKYCWVQTTSIVYLSCEVVVCGPEVDPADLQELVPHLQARLPCQAVGRYRRHKHTPR